MKSRSSVLVVFVILLTLMLCRPGFVVSAADITSLPASGTWPAGTLTESLEVAVTSGPVMTGTIVIPSGLSLTITMGAVSGDHVTLSTDASFTGTSMFKVESGGSLTIKGTSYNKYFGIRGGNDNLTVLDENGATIASNNKTTKLGSLVEPSGKVFPDLKNGAICSSGTLHLENVRIYDVVSSSRGAITIPQDGYKTKGTTTLKGCWIHRCKAVRGTALMIEAQTQFDTSGNVIAGGENTATSCAVSLEDVLIYRCTVKGEDGPSGIIRTYGNCAGNINLKDVEICQNLSEGNGTAIFWNAHGHPDTKMTFDGCNIHNNHAAGDGGAISFEGSFEFKNNITNIYKNTAGNEGGAILIKTYGSTNAQGVSDLKMDFNKFVSIHDNEAAVNGGGMAVVLGTSTLPKGSSISLSLDGATISNNDSKSSGGGVYFYSNVTAGSGLDIGLNVTGNAVISGNTAVNSGGGLYIRRIDGTEQVEVHFAQGSITGNRCTDGGGAYLAYMDAECAEGLVFSGNKASKDGAGMLITHGNVTMSGGKFEGNEAQSYGGGVYVLEGGFTMSGGEFVSNKCNGRGGGLYSKNADIIIEGGKFTSNWAALTEAGLTGGTIYGGAISCTRDANRKDPEGTYSMILRGGVFTDNRADRGGAVHVSVANVLVDKLASNEVEMSKNWAENTGAAIAVYDGGSVTINGGKFLNNESLNTGGAIHINTSGGKVLMTDGLFDGNSAVVFGGAINMTAGELTINGGTYTNNKCVSGAASTGSGGAIYVRYPASCSIAGGTFQSNQASNLGGAMFFAGNQCFLKGGLITENSAAVAGGGIALTRYNDKDDDDKDGVTSYDGAMTIEGGTISANTAGNVGGLGGGLYVTNSTVSMSEGNVDDNRVNKGFGAGIYVKDGAMTFLGGSISRNVVVLKADEDLLGTSDVGSYEGGGIYFEASSVEAEGSYSLQLRGGVLDANKASKGGAVLLKRANALFEPISSGAGTVLSNNYARYVGAAIAVYSGSSITVNGGQFVANSVPLHNGGAIYMGSTGKMLLAGGVFSDNYCLSHGGAINVNGGTCTITDGLFERNYCTSIADGSGGAIYLNAGQNCYITGGTFLSNSSPHSGGAIALESSTVNISGGQFTDNSSRYGGALYANTSSVVSMSNGSITSNSAVNGGGLFLAGGSSMTFSDGFIANNKALVNLTSDLKNNVTTTTAYDSSTNLFGVGGGVFLGEGSSGKVTTMTFNMTAEDSFGLYNNLAEIAADDIYAYGKYTSITLPDISKMSLKGYSSRTSELYWVEDFMTGDTAYHDYGTNMNTSASYSPIRYRDAIAAQTEVYKVVTTDPITKYVALSLGHEVIYITLQKTGLKAGESAIFRVLRVDNGVSSVYSEVLLTGKDGQDVQSKRVALYSGTWKITEIPWTWSYDIEPVSYERNITGATAAEDKIFVFTGVKKVSAPLHAEDIVTNDFGEGTATTGSYVDPAVISDL